MSKTTVWTFAAALALVVGCGSVPKPEARLSSDEGAIRGAEEAGANGVPEAALHVKLAQEQREQAQKEIANGDNHRAAKLLERSEADAELALALARQAAATTDASKAREADESLKSKSE
jgi:hypothetical protein